MADSADLVVLGAYFGTGNKGWYGFALALGYYSKQELGILPWLVNIAPHILDVCLF